MDPTIMSRRWCTLLLVVLVTVSCCEALPTFLSLSYSTTVSELTPVGSILVNITAIPGSPGNTLSYIIFNHPPTIVDIDSSTGSVVLIGPLDYEQETRLEFNVEVAEGLDVAMTPVTINVLNANDEVPLCSPTIYTLTVPESSTVGSPLLSLSCSDSDGDSLEYTLDGDSEELFTLTQINPLTTSLSLAAEVDSEALSTLSILVDVFDGQHSVQLKVFVYVEPSNEHVPTFTQSVYDCSVSESAAIGSVFCSVVAEDDDIGPDGELTYSISSGNEANTFGIDASTGEIILAGCIDYESVQGYLVILRVTDNGESSFENWVQVRITVLDSNDNAPVINPLITGSIAENSPQGTIITALECSDADSGTNGAVELTITSQTNSDRADVAVFSIDSSTNELIADFPIDYEETLFFTVSLTCNDKGSPSLSSSSIVIVRVSPLNEFAPEFSSDDYSATIAETSSVGTSVLEVAATDNDRGTDGIIVYSIAAEGVRDFLQISETSGVITTRELLNCDWGQEHVFTITATDGGTPSLISQSQLTVSLSNCRLGRLISRESVYFASVAENSPVNTEVVTVACDFDREVHGNPEYSIVSPSTPPFVIDSMGGGISVATPPDHEQASSHMLQVKCTDPNDIESYIVFSVYVTITPENEHTPEFATALYEAEISEAALPGSSVVTIEGVDEDSGTDGSVVYNIQEDDQFFIVDTNTGIVYTRAYLDREKESQHLFHVVAMDQNGGGESTRSSVVEVRVTVTDSNDNSPECDRIVYHVKVSPLLEVGESILSLDCSDPDVGPNSELHFSLEYHSSGSMGQFDISDSTGDLVLARPFSHELPVIVVHEMVVTVADHGEPSRSTAALVIVELESEPVVAGDGGGGTATEVEGLQNSATFTMRDMSLKLWDAGGRESFQEAMAHSITNHCALLPESCSMLSGCDHFYSRKRRAANEYFVSIFTEENVAILPESVIEFSEPDGITNLNLSFYITLPSGTKKSEYRTTDYVVPGITLSLLVRDEGPVIESQVRGKIAPYLTQKSDGDPSRDWMWAVIAILVAVMCTCIALFTCYIVQILKSVKKGAAIAPINLLSLTDNKKSCPKPTVQSSSVTGKTETKRLLLRDLAQSPTVYDPGQERLTPESGQEDDISTIHLVAEDSNGCSLQGQPPSHGSTAISSAVSGKSVARKSQKIGSKSSSVGDYKQNFPYEPPRESQGDRLHHSRLRPVVAAIHWN